LPSPTFRTGNVGLLMLTGDHAGSRRQLAGTVRAVDRDWQRFRVVEHPPGSFRCDTAYPPTVCV